MRRGRAEIRLFVRRNFGTTSTEGEDIKVRQGNSKVSKVKLGSKRVYVSVSVKHNCTRFYGISK